MTDPLSENVFRGMIGTVIPVFILLVLAIRSLCSIRWFWSGVHAAVITTAAAVVAVLSPHLSTAMLTMVGGLVYGLAIVVWSQRRSRRQATSAERRP